MGKSTHFTGQPAVHKKKWTEMDETAEDNRLHNDYPLLQPAAHDNAEEAHTLLELFGLGHNGQDNTDVLCGFLQPL